MPYLGYVNNVVGGDERRIGVYLLAAGLFGYAAYMFVSAGREHRRHPSPDDTPAEHPSPPERRKPDVLRRALCWTVLLSFVLTIDAGAARADEVGLSLDGQVWTSVLRRPLFDPAFRWVPGDTETRSLWVRNQGPTPASMRITLRTTDPDLLLARDDLRSTPGHRRSVDVAGQRSGQMGR